MPPKVSFLTAISVLLSIGGVTLAHPEARWVGYEGFFSVFKRGIRGVYQHCSSQHLHRYMAEFDFRYSNRVAKGVNDVERTEAAVASIVGKRLTYQRANEARYA